HVTGVQTCALPICGDLDEPEEVVRPPGVGLHLRRCALAPPPAARPAHAPPAPLPPLGAVDQRRGSQRNHRRTANTDSAVQATAVTRDRKSTRLNSSHVKISYAVFCL